MERAARISSNYLDTLAGTCWLNETISTYSEDYELVCPYYKLGCRAVCRRAVLTKHMRECTYAFEIAGVQSYESLVCIHLKV